MIYRGKQEIQGKTYKHKTITYNIMTDVSDDYSTIAVRHEDKEKIDAICDKYDMRRVRFIGLMLELYINQNNINITDLKNDRESKNSNNKK